MKEPAFGEMVDGIAKGIVEVLTDRGTLGSPTKSFVKEAIADGVAKAMLKWINGSGYGVRTEQLKEAITDGVSAAVWKFLEKHPDALRPSNGGSR